MSAPLVTEGWFLAEGWWVNAKIEGRLDHAAYCIARSGDGYREDELWWNGRAYEAYGSARDMSMLFGTPKYSSNP